MSESDFAKRLLRWNETDNDRTLIWRGEKAPYKVWLREIILQQTRVKQGEAYYRRFLSKYPDIVALAAADESDAFKLWEGLGYYSRCSNLLQTAKVIVTKYEGIFPKTYKEIIKLKGIGAYTAAAICSFAYNQPYAVVDGNVKRVLTRYYGIMEPIDTTIGSKTIENLAQSLISVGEPATYNQAMMDFGAKVCTPRNPDCIHCPMNQYCVAYQTGKVDLLPIKSKKIKVKSRFFTYFVIESKNNLFIRQRNSPDIWQRLYEFPYVETNTLLQEKDILNLTEMKALANLDPDMNLKEVSTVFSQRLTHQLIKARFVFIQLSGYSGTFMESIPFSKRKILTKAFPKIIKEYLKRFLSNNK